MNDIYFLLHRENTADVIDHFHVEDNKEADETYLELVAEAFEHPLEPDEAAACLNDGWVEIADQRTNESYVVILLQDKPEPPPDMVEAMTWLLNDLIDAGEHKAPDSAVLYASVENAIRAMQGVGRADWDWLLPKEESREPA